MAKLLIILTLICFSTLIANSESLFQENKTIIPPPIRVYLHEIASGPNASLYEVARASISTSQLSFGIVYVGDSALRAGPDPNSQQLGQNQGTTTTTGLYEPAIVVDFNFLFAAGKYKGSSLKVAGQKLTLGKDQEIPITGGTGFFRGARGYSLSSFISFNPATNTYVFLYSLHFMENGHFPFGTSGTFFHASK